MISLPKTCKLPNAGCRLYVSVDYTLVFMVNIILDGIHSGYNLVLDLH